jgi:O-antigen ligase
MSDAAVSHPGISTRRELWSTLADSALVVGFPLLALVSLASANGGFFATSWGWAALAFCWLAALVLLLRAESDVGRLDLAFFALLTLFAGWIWLSATWSQEVPRSILEGERALVALTGVAAAVLVVSRRTSAQLLAGVAGGIALIGTYALATRLFPDKLARFDAVAGYRLEQPVGYWNALGIFSALGVLLCVGFALRARTLWARAFAAAALAVLLPAIYFTYSRGTWVALAIALAVVVAFDPRRLQFLAGVGVLGPLLALEVWLGSRKYALTHREVGLAAATREGRSYALVVVGVAVAVALLAVGFALVERRWSVPRALRLAFAAVLAAAAVAALAGAVARYGGPQTMARHTWNSFKAPPVTDTSNLNQRLFSFSGNGRVDLWAAAWHDHNANPVLGSGAGTFNSYWNQHRPNHLNVLDAHSLYAEVLGELGPLGLALVALALLVPLVAAVRARGDPLVPAAAGAYVAYLIHAGVDWDWEMTALTLAALLVGVSMLAAARNGRPRPLRPVVRGALVAGAVGLAAVAFVALVGNLKLARAEHAAGRGDWAKAITEARSAHTWAPWSADALRTIGDAQRRSGHPAAAAHTLAEAVRKDPRDSDLWYDLYLAANGRLADRAFANAVRLDPLSFDAKDRRAVLGAGSG